MISVRHCSKPGCAQPAVATLTYDYHASTAVLGPLATQAEPHTYDLCENHAGSLSAPQGWQIVRLQTTFEPQPPSADDLEALADAVRRAAQMEPPAPPTPSATIHHLHKDEVRESFTPLTGGASYPRIPQVESEPVMGPFARKAPATEQNTEDADEVVDSSEPVSQEPVAPVDLSSPWSRMRRRFSSVTDSED